MDFNVVPETKAVPISSGSRPRGKAQPGKAVMSAGAEMGEARGKPMVGSTGKCADYANIMRNNRTEYELHKTYDNLALSFFIVFIRGMTQIAGKSPNQP